MMMEPCTDICGSLDEEELAELYFSMGRCVKWDICRVKIHGLKVQKMVGYWMRFLIWCCQLCLQMQGAIDATATEFEFGQTYFGVKDHPTGTLYIPCELGEKYNWQITSM